MLGKSHVRTLSVLGFPNMSRPGILDTLNHQDFAYRWVTRFIALDKAQATKALTSIRRQWFNKRKSVRSEEHTSELQSLMRISYAVFCLKKKNKSTRLKKTKNTT